ncbi:cation diffusion facilitator family transporter [Actinotignum urinale]|uniref:Cation diffusion facilitator family transporter n=1 Tax=Actinotignum urinale TaxID=190146 RepID=A0AAW9HMX8_9ACTO|nr:cation diffusion facilitator family transporter [Actinotignum urinale]MDY5155011.1 cation diffusion facilitator family transporter [Actinotignum urinale]
MNKQAQLLIRCAWLSIATAIFTIAFKASGYYLTASVSLLSDATESLVNLVAAVVALLALKTASKPADKNFTYGRGKAEYFSAAIEGALIFTAAAFILFSAVSRILHPQPLEELGLGLIIVLIATTINATVGIFLIHMGKTHRSPTLRADGAHLLTDVVTSIGVIIGIGLVWLTGEPVADSIVAIILGLNILWTGYVLVRDALAGLMDASLPEDYIRIVVETLNSHARTDLRFHGLQTRVSGRESFCNFHMLVSGSMTVADGHELAEDIADELAEKIPGLSVHIHIEPLEDPRSYEDIPEGHIPLGGITDAIPDVVVRALTEKE